MKIGIDASRALRKIKTGTEYYSEQIILNLAKIDHKNNYSLYSNISPKPPLLNLPNNFHWRVMPFFRGWTLLRLSLEMKKNPPDVLFIPAHTLPLITPKKSVVMVHDIGFVHFPKLYPARQKIYHNFVLWYVKKHATHILTPSEFVKNDLIKTLKIKKSKITVIYHGFDKKLYQKSADKNHLSVKLIPYIFFLGRLEAKKNLITLIRAFEIVRKNSKEKIKLVLAGNKSHGYKKIKKEIEKSKFKKDIILPGYIKEEDVPIWLSSARLFVFPSQNEGFGFPVIEAQACGCPVICSNITSLPEIADSGALYFNPQDEKDLANKIIKILNNKELQKELIKKGSENIKRFSWAAAAIKTKNILESI